MDNLNRRHLSMSTRCPVSSFISEVIPKSKGLLSLSSSGSDSDNDVEKTVYEEKLEFLQKTLCRSKILGSLVELWHLLASSEQSGCSRDDHGFQVGEMRYASVRDLKGKLLTDIREYCIDSEGEMKQRRKGNSLNREQWSLLKEQISGIDDAIRKL
ncbi:activated RNA polymerase II transcriptional coactivator p15-like [Acomys russatus]|uniref:activated RNA polymerase II transcriptional coactivator p15-like n=1 Tax=Acomys russatus TaxID=60746 RepID=UPI0021E25A34|nr:activated RNA polymerase II transcriptional coactivator p15-like [Acomys russatus]